MASPASLFSTLCLSLQLAATTAVTVTLLSGCGGGHSDGSVPPPPASQQQAVAAADFNRDGRVDLAVSAIVGSGQAPHPGQVEISLQRPDGFFDIPVIFGVGSDPAEIAAADINGDSRADIVVADSTSDTVSLLINDTTRPGGFRPAVSHPCGPKPLGIAVADIDGNGMVDIVVAVADGVDILYQDAPEVFTLETVPVPSGTFAVATGDLDGDGIPDIAATATDRVIVFFQSKALPGDFSQKAEVVAGIQPNGIALADFDRDGLTDMAIANIGAPETGNDSSVSIIRQDPQVARRFLPVTSIATANGTRSIKTADLDGNGRVDLVLTSVVLSSNTPGTVTVLLQNSSGSFLSSTYANGFTPLSTAIQDLDGDGRPDIAIQDGPAILYQDPLHPGFFFNEVVVGP